MSGRPGQAKQPAGPGCAGITRRQVLTRIGVGLAGVPLLRPGSSRGDLVNSRARVVVIGGGWAGLIIARYLAAESGLFDVTLVEKGKRFFSHPLSNLWLAGQVKTDFLTHRYEDAAASGGYRLIQQNVLDVDSAQRKVITTDGKLDYDLLVLAPGIDYDYERSGMDDAEAIRELKNRYPAGFIGEAEIAAVKQKVENFTQGTFVLTVPNDNYRCMAAPYERACMIASVFKRRKLAAKVLLLDMNSSPRVKAEGFLHAFERLHRDYIEYVPSTEITGFDPFNRLVLTEFDEYSFDDAAIYPKVRASRLLEKIGIADPANPQKAAITDPFNYRLMNDERIYVIGDARSQPFSKSGNTASTEARYLARQITAYAQGVEIPWEGPQTMCFSGVRTEPLEAMSLLASYKFDAQANAFGFDRVLTIQDWSEQIARAGLVWGEAAYNEMFYYAVSG